MAQYVVQRREKNTADEGWRWQDVNTVQAAGRARRATVLKNALRGEVDPDAEYRVLDEASAHVYAIKSETQTKLVIS